MPPAEEPQTDQQETPRVEQLNSDTASKSDLQKSVSGKYSSGIVKEDATAEIPSTSAETLLKAGVQSVSLQIASDEEGDRLSFATSGGSPDRSADCFELLLTDGDNEDYRYVYFQKDEEGDWEKLSGSSASMSLSDEVLRKKSYYLRPEKDIDDENVNLKSLPVSALPGETVKIAPQCAYGYEISNLVVRDKNGEEIFVDHQEFLMPYGPVSISFTVVKILYHVQFFVDGKLFAEKDYALGEAIVPPVMDTVPTKESDGEYEYTFLRWSNDLHTASGEERELQVEAVFAKTLLHYEEKTFNLRGLFRKPAMILLGVVLLLVGTIVFLVCRRRKRIRAAMRDNNNY